MGKNRSKSKHNHLKVTRKTKKKKVPHLNYHDRDVQKAWTHKRTLQQNYEALGIVTNPNDISKLTALDPEGIPERPPVEPELDIEETLPREREEREPRLSHQEILNCRRLVAKYGDDYKAMTRDHKLNRYQLTKAQLKKKMRLYYAKYRDSAFDDPLAAASIPATSDGIAPAAAAAAASSSSSKQSGPPKNKRKGKKPEGDDYLDWLP